MKQPRADHSLPLDHDRVKQPIADEAKVAPNAPPARPRTTKAKGHRPSMVLRAPPTNTSRCSATTHHLLATIDLQPTLVARKSRQVAVRAFPQKQ